MADDADNAMALEQAEREAIIAKARKPLSALTDGECLDCGEMSDTLRGGVCTDCRSIKEQMAGRFAGY